MTRTVVGSFDTLDHARDVIDALHVMGVAHGDVSLVTHDAAGRLSAGREPAGASRERDLPAGGDVAGDAATAAGRGAIAGSVLGGGAGLIAGLVGLAVPGLGPLRAAGPIVAAMAGASLGALAGGLVGGLRQVGVSDVDAEYYAEAVRRGGVLVVVRAPQAQAKEVAATMHRHGAIDIESRVAAWQASGWKGAEARPSPWARELAEAGRRADAGTGTAVPDPRSGGMTGTPLRAGTPAPGTGGGRPPGLTGTTRASEHPNLGTGSDRPGVDTRSHDHSRRTDRSGAAADGDPAEGSGG
jgi:hypothetical protein